MPKVTILDIGHEEWANLKAARWLDNRKELYVDTEKIRVLLGGGTDRLILSIRDGIIIKALRSKRNIIVGGNNNTLEQVERIAEVVEATDFMDYGSEVKEGEEYKPRYVWKVKRF